MKKTLLCLILMVLCMASLASADSFLTFNNRVTGAPTDVIDWGQLGPPGTQLGSPVLVFSAGLTNAALAGNLDGSPVVTALSGYNWNGNFDYGENLVWTGNANYGYGGLGPFGIEFAVPVGTLGFGIQADLYGPFNVAVDIFDSSLNYMTTLTFSGNSFFSLAGDNLFIGIQDKTAVNIGGIIISTVSPNDPTGGMFTNDFAIDAVSFNYATPEPGSLMLLGTGLIGVAGVVRRKLGR